MTTVLGLVCLALPTGGDLPVVTVRADNTVIAASCRIAIPPGLVVADADGDGVLHVTASDIVLEFDGGATLRGADANATPDTYEGYGVRVVGQRNVTIRGGRISGFRAAIWATEAPGLTIEHVDASDGRRMRLASDPELEAGEDWLYPHHNDEREWLRNHGAAFYVERSDGLVVRNCRVWHGQHALCLDRVNEARIYDNDFSFNSGWGIALWRSSRNTITRNALDFCIRGYSHDVYNRGQDSAGLLLFEQDSDNVIAENSVTHGGDGFFGWAGYEAMARSSAPASAPAGAGATTAPAACGTDRNLLVRNDFSYAAAHGIELTFSFGNRFIANRVVGNAICGIWAGYSQDTLIANNEIAENGGAGYGLERGGVNIDSSRRNRIIGNRFNWNGCGVHLWWHTQQPEGLAAWAAANIPDCEGNIIAGNAFHGDELGLHFRGPGHVRLAANTMVEVGGEMHAEPTTTVVRDATFAKPVVDMPEYPVFGETRPVGARPELAGRDKMVMTEWGPWDHVSPLVWPVETTGGEHTYALWRCGEQAECTVEGDVAWERTGTGPDSVVTLRSERPGVYPYRLLVRSGEFCDEKRGALLVAQWDVACFRFAGDLATERDAWRRAAEGVEARTAHVARLNDRAVAEEMQGVTDAAPATKKNAGWGLVARARVPIERGTWRIVVVGRGGVCVSVDGRSVIEAWEPQAGSRRLIGPFTAEGGEVEFVVENAGGGRLRLPTVRILPAGANTRAGEGGL